MHDDELRSHFDYNPQTGEIRRKTRRSSNGSKDVYGYLIIKFKKHQYKAHRLAWFLHYGEWPSENIDHINRDKLDNRIKNLRDVPQSVNVENTHRLPNPGTGVVGVYVDKYTKGLKKKYTTRLGGKTYRFYSLDDAVAFRKGLLVNNK